MISWFYYATSYYYYIFDKNLHNVKIYKYEVPVTKQYHQCDILYGKVEMRVPVAEQSHQCDTYRDVIPVAEQDISKLPTRGCCDTCSDGVSVTEQYNQCDTL